MGSVWKAKSASAEETHHPLGPFEDGAELARFVFAQPRPDIDVEFLGMFNVSLSGRALPAGVDMRMMLERVRDSILPRFECFF